MIKFIYKSLSALVLIIAIQTSLCAQVVLPLPMQMTKQEGSLQIQKISISADPALKNEEAHLNKMLTSDFGLSSNASPKGTKVNLNLDPKLSPNPEAYQLTINSDGIKIVGSSAAGVLYGVESLRQLIKKVEKGLMLNHVTINDAPQFKIRSFMLDEARYFKGKKVVMALLDEMALLKLNTFHWHLTDDQGWRIEIKKYPLLTEIGSKREWSQTGGWNSKTNDATPHSGFYTQEDIKEIVAYAKRLHINVIPEIEMPGHSTAAVASYPWLGVTKEKIATTGMFGVHYNIFDVTDPKVMTFLKDVLDEVLAIFPSKIIHIGGDEVKFNAWNESPSVQAYMKEKGLKSPADLQVYFTNQISNYITSKGRRMMGWNDIMGAKLHDYNKNDAPATGKLSPESIVQFWTGNPSLMKTALEQGYDILNSYHSNTYLDYSFTSISLEKAYNFNPIPKDLESKFIPQVLGSGAQMWGEWIPTVSRMNELIFPRLAALAEVGWTQVEKKDFNSFKQRLPYFYKRWERLGIEYHKF